MTSAATLWSYKRESFEQLTCSRLWEALWEIPLNKTSQRWGGPLNGLHSTSSRTQRN